MNTNHTPQFRRRSATEQAEDRFISSLAPDQQAETLRIQDSASFDWRIFCKITSLMLGGFGLYCWLVEMGIIS